MSNEWSIRLENLIDNLDYCGHDMYYDDFWQEAIIGIRVLFFEMSQLVDKLEKEVKNNG